MRLIDRYLLRELLLPFCYCLAGFLIFWISCDLLLQFSEYQKLRLRARDVMDLYVVQTPGILVLTLPMAFLLALLYSLTNHARHNELTAIRAAGISLFRLSMPYVAVGIILSVSVFAMSEFLVPSCSDAAEEIQVRYQGERSATAAKRQWEAKLGHYNPIERRWWLVESYHLFTGEMIRPHIVWLQTNGPRVDIFADGAAWVDQRWTFTNAHRLTYVTKGAEPVQELLPELTIPEFTETPDQIRSEIKINRLRSFKQARKTQLSIREVLEYWRLHPSGVPSSLQSVLMTKLHGQMASPWTCLVVVAIALPFGAQSGRRNVVVGVASSIFICFAYFITQQISLSLGAGGHILPWIAAWAPNVLFGVTGLILSWRLR